MVSSNIFDGIKLHSAKLSSVNQASIESLNNAMFNTGGVCFSSLLPLQYNTVGFINQVYLGLGVGTTATYTDIPGGYNSSFNLMPTGINYGTDATKPFAIVELQDYSIFIEYIKISNGYPNNDFYEIASLVGGLPANNLIPYQEIWCSSRNYFVSKGGGEKYNDWYIVMSATVYNRNEGSSNNRTIVNNAIPIIPYVGDNYNYPLVAGAEAYKKIATLQGSFASTMILAPFTRCSALPTSFNALGNVYYGQNGFGPAEIPNWLIGNYIKHSYLGDNIKIVGFGRELSTLKAAYNATEFYGAVDFGCLAFKTPSDILALYSDWGINTATFSRDSAISAPREQFPEPPDISGSDTFVPDNGEKSGFPINPVVPNLPSYPDNTSDVILDETPNISVLNVSKLYAMKIGNVKTFLNWLLTDDFTKNISELFSDKISALNSIQLFPFDFLLHDSTHLTAVDKITIGGVEEVDNSGYMIEPNYSLWFDGGSIKLLAYYGNYNDYINSSYWLYIPYGGILEISASMVVNCELTIRYAVDVISGDSTAVIRSNGVIVKTIPCHVSQSIPIVYNNNNEIAIKNAINSVSIGNSLLGSAVNVVEGNFVGALGNLANAGSSAITNSLTNRTRYGHIGTIGINTFNVLPQYPFLIISRYQIAPYSDVYSIGKPVSYYGKISSFKSLGFIKAKTEISISGATVEEEKEIRTILENGMLL